MSPYDQSAKTEHSNIGNAGSNSTPDNNPEATEAEIRANTIKANFGP